VRPGRVGWMSLLAKWKPRDDDVSRCPQCGAWRFHEHCTTPARRLSTGKGISATGLWTRSWRNRLCACQIHSSYGYEGGSMGLGNVKLAYARWVHLPDRSFRLLVFMALVSMDEDTPPQYWGGREKLAYALGRRTPDEPARTDSSMRAIESRKTRAADFQAVKESMRPLTNTGAVILETPATQGRNAVYSLALLAEPSRGNLPESVGETYPSGRGNLPPGVGETYPRGGNPPTGGYPTEEQPGTNTGTKSPLGINSPANSVVYANSQKFLAKYPDLGAAFLARIPEEVTGMQERVILAAGLARSEAS